MSGPVDTELPGTVQELAGIVWFTPGPVTVQDVVIPVAEYVIVLESPDFTRVGFAVMVPVGAVHAPPPTEALAEQEPPEPVQESVYEPTVFTETLPFVAPPVENPPPVQEVAFVEDQESVEGTVLGEAESEHVGTGCTAAATVTGDHGPQLFPSFDSAMVPELPADDLSAQART